jgi:hypothetical protein
LILDLGGDVEGIGSTTLRVRCPEITTVTYDLSPETQAISGLPVIND